MGHIKKKISRSTARKIIATASSLKSCKWIAGEDKQMFEDKLEEGFYMEVSRLCEKDTKASSALHNCKIANCSTEYEPDLRCHL